MQVIIKPTEACNGTCVYCAASSTLDRKRMLRADRLGELFQAFNDWLARDERHQLRFTWHGGEPMLCGPEYYDRVIEEQHRVFGANLPRVGNSMQSNLTLINEKWIPRLHKLLDQRQVGTSFDIIEGIRGLACGRNLAELWIPAVKRLYQNGISVGAIYTVHKKSLGRARDLYYFFRNLGCLAGMRFNPLYREGRGGQETSEPIWITAEEYGQFLVELCKVWMADDMRFRVRPVEEWYHAWMGMPRLCCDSKGDCHQTHIGINPNGDVYGCGRASDHRDNRLGNIFENDLEEMLARWAHGPLASRAELLQATYCHDCRYWELCHGGCPMMAYIYYGDLCRETYFCATRKLLLGHFEEVIGPPVTFRTAGQEPSKKELVYA